MIKKDYLTMLNEEQYEVATTIEGMNFVLAGAGSGKTRALTNRVAYMLEQGIDPREILLLTFTNKAAKEMKTRIEKMVGEKAQHVTASTFHSFCAIFIRKNARLMGFKEDYTILDSADMMDAIGIAKQDFLQIAKENGKEYNLKDFPKAAIIASVYEGAVNNCTDYEQMIVALSKTNDEVLVYKNEIIEILEIFKNYKREKNLMDYNDLLYYTEKLLSTDEEIRRNIDRQYKYISCDEYQDTNTVQNNILELMSRDYPNLTVVGDDNQSIYAFRYANIQNILGFESKHPDCKTIILNKNYRSSQEILDFCNEMMEYAKEGKKKYLQSNLHGEKPKLIVKSDCYEEADYIIEKIVKRDIDTDLSDIAVICRSASQSYILEQKLMRLGIPYNKYGGIKFMEKAVIKDLLAFLRVSVNEQDELSWFRILQLYPGIGKAFARKISQAISDNGWEDVLKTYKKRVFFKYIEEIKAAYDRLTSVSLEEQMEYLIDEYYFTTMSRNIALKETDENKKSEMFASLKEQVEDARILQNMASKYRSTNAFINDIVLDATNEDDTEDKLNITTIHSAKGLEYDTVFIMDCIEGVTPRCDEYDSEDAEELRCMYVAATRAKKHLYILIPQYYNMKKVKGVVSHFINKNNIFNTMQRNVDNRTLSRLCEKRPIYWF